MTKPTLDQWSAAASKEVKGKDLSWETPEGIPVKPLYTQEDVEGARARGRDAFGDLGHPSQASHAPPGV